MHAGRLKRREFITPLGGAAASWPLAARAQQADRMRRIGVLMSLAADDPQSQARMTAFVQGLQQLGWTDGRNVRIDYRWGINTDRVRKNAVELVALAPDVILAHSSPAVLAPRGRVREITCKKYVRRGGHKVCRVNTSAIDRDAHDSNCFCRGLRSGRKRLCRELCAARRQHPGLAPSPSRRPHLLTQCRRQN
jgi:hypothetical protein